MTTHKERILAAMRGEMVDVIPFAPRLDLWWLANSLGGTLPEQYREMTHDQIARANGWALYKMVPDFASVGSFWRACKLLSPNKAALSTVDLALFVFFGGCWSSSSSSGHR